MKLVEIKNSLAKLYYEPSDFPLVLSDFLTVDDSNKKIIAQVVSIESTSKETTNCAILKFSLDLNEDNTHSSYSGYVPPLDALVSKTKPQTIKNIFSDSNSGVKLGELTNSSHVEIYVKSTLLNSFLYIQSDRDEETQNIIEKLLQYNFEKSRKTLYVDFDGVIDYPQSNVIELGKDFKLPIDNDTLNYIYEYDLTGLTVEQKTIVQDIILEIQDYINTLESGFIPFDTLLNVVNDIYQSDKSVGVILLRNKLLKYNQFNIFASKEEEINSLKSAVNENDLTVFSIKNTAPDWQKKALDYVVKNLSAGYFLISDVKDEAFDTAILNRIYKANNIKPVFFSKYDSDFASQIKSFAKNLILFKPQSIQRAFATYNSFLNKLSQKEFIVSGESTYYTPLIIKELPEKIEDAPHDDTSQANIPAVQAEIIPPVDEVDTISPESKSELTADTETVELEELSELEPLEEEDDSNELKNIFEESLEQEIAKDVDKMFYAEAALPGDEAEHDLSAELEDLVETVSDSHDEILNEAETSQELNYEELLSDDDLDLLDEFNAEEELPPLEQTAEENVNFDNLTSEAEDFNESFNEKETASAIPIYQTQIDEKIKEDDVIQFAEGNIVYHEKYGRGVVEQIMSYGQKTLCSIQFDNVGRRLLDPNLADLKQM